MKITREINGRIKGMLKVELHRHLEGCVRPGTVIDIAKKHDLKLPTFDRGEFEKIYKLAKPMKSLREVLRMFNLAQNSFISYETIEQITCEAIEDACENENIILLELRYSPDFMLQGKNLDWNESLQIIKSVAEYFERTRNILCGIIIIASRSYGMDSVLKTLDFAIKNRRNVIGFDLADNESDYPSRLYENVAKKLRMERIPLTVHSGEEGDFSQVAETVEYLSPSRIGHGVKIAEDETGETMKMVKDSDITIEANPFSNYLTNAVKSLEEHPLKKFIDYGLKVSIGADDPEILGTNLNKEYTLCLEKMNLSLEDILHTLKCAVASSFLEKDKKQEAFKLLGLKH